MTWNLDRLRIRFQLVLGWTWHLVPSLMREQQLLWLCMVSMCFHLSKCSCKLVLNHLLNHMGSMHHWQLRSWQPKPKLCSNILRCILSWSCRMKLRFYGDKTTFTFVVLNVATHILSEKDSVNPNAQHEPHWPWSLIGWTHDPQAASLVGSKFYGSSGCGSGTTSLSLRIYVPTYLFISSTDMPANWFSVSAVQVPISINLLLQSAKHKANAINAFIWFWFTS